MLTERICSQHQARCKQDLVSMDADTSDTNISQSPNVANCLHMVQSHQANSQYKTTSFYSKIFIQSTMIDYSDSTCLDGISLIMLPD